MFEYLSVCVYCVRIIGRKAELILSLIQHLCDLDAFSSLALFLSYLYYLKYSHMDVEKTV